MSNAKTCNRLRHLSSKQIMAALLLSACASCSLAQTVIEVFTDKPIMAPVIPNAAITVFDLSQVDAIKKTAPRFSPNEGQAKLQAKAWLESPDGKMYVNNLKKAYESRTKMMGYGIQKIPAIVFGGGQFVIYGTSDVARAVADYDHYIRTHKSR